MTFWEKLLCHVFGHRFTVRKMNGLLCARCRLLDLSSVSRGESE